MENYNMAVIGGGPGGYVCAIKAAQLGLKVALIEKEDLGGTCLNWGCIPAKSLIRNAEIVNNFRNAQSFGISLGESGFSADYSLAHQRSREVSGRLSGGVSHLLKKNGVTVYSDEAVITSRNRIELKKRGRYISCDNMVLAVGADAVSLFGLEPDGRIILLPRQALDLKELPKRAVIIGAGAIGMEFASIWHAYGVEVTIVEALPRLLPREDAEISAELERQYRKKGIEVLTGSMVTRIDDGSGNSSSNSSSNSGNSGSDGLTVRVKTSAGSELSLKTDSVLFALGVRPRISAAGIGSLDLRLEGNALWVNDKMETTEPGVYAVGDINGRLPLAHTASAQGMIAAMAAAGFETEKLVYENIPRCTYCFPEAASTGLTGAEAEARGYEVKTGTFPLSANGKALASGEEEGFTKIIADKKTGEILGVHMAGAHVTEMIGGMALALKLETTTEELSSTVFPHPTVSESIIEAAHAVTGKAIHF